ncbi:DNA-binding domain-containing protein [Nitrospirillum sp. BR 11163]|uniref:HvfC/BufC N-terminal domain-containing protein n=1 Tax=Nitrospirillum sp. BR 11163 TaxID=3104323 RepID=UPI002AFEE693|nr:DNA-binding domain-containing protein [Nitrospirillum sp. BR 11163]MEA1672275.1 DNA-binding domain-containing protein [Nitrospirillum sp. BR 11163]
MPTLLERQRELRDWVLTPNRIPPWPNAGLHRDNTLGGLAATLAGTFPVVQRLVGEACFIGLAQAYVRHQPPHEAPLLRYGAGFPAWLAGQDVARQLPYLADVARLEAAWTHAYHAAEATPVDTGALAALGDAVEETVWRLHPSHRFVASPWPVDRIWRANQPGSDDAAVDLDGDRDTHLLVVRPAADVLLIRLSPSAFALLMALGAGLPLGSAWDNALALDAGFNLEHELTGLLAAQVFIGVELP